MSVPEAFTLVVDGGEEVRQTSLYVYNNRDRMVTPRQMVLQRTLSGCGFISRGQNSYDIPEGKVALFAHPDDTRYGYPEDGTQPYRFRWISFLDSNVITPLFDRLRADFGLALRMAAKSESCVLFDEIWQRYRDRSFRDRFHQADLVHQMLIALYREQVDAIQAVDPAEYGRHFIRSHFRSPMTLKEIADHCGVSREHFIRVFGSRYGESPGAFMRRLRFELAVRMLQSGTHGIDTIAKNCGFTSATAFCRAFKQFHGRSPGELRTRM